MSSIDMHVHTTSSDGILTPSQVVEWANKLNLKGLAITDHDTVDGISEAIKVSNNLNIIIIPGIEFSTIYKEKEVHILGYFIDYKNNDLVSITKKIKYHRVNRVKKIINKLKELNIDIEDNFKIEIKGKAIGRPHIARILIEEGYVDSVDEAFERYLSKGKPAYVSRYKLSLEDAIKIIKTSGGIPVLAHPGLLHDSLDINEVCNKGMVGIEVYHTKHSPEETEHFKSLAKKLDLIITGGSDFHDQFINGIPILGSIGVSLQDFLNYGKSEKINIKTENLLK